MKINTTARLAALLVLGVRVATAGGADAASPPPGAGPLASDAILKSTDYGKSMTRSFPAQTTARQVVKATVPDLLAFFGERPKLVGVYQDQKDKKSACVFFSETLNGQAVKGLSVIKVTEDATREWVVFCRAGAPKGEAMKLLSLHQPEARPTDNGGASAAVNGAGTGNTPGGPASVSPTTRDASAKQTVADGSSGDGNLQSIPPADIKLQTYRFPDGTGTVGVPEGWTCESRTIGNCIVKGPADQIVGLDLSAVVDVPNGPSIRRARQFHLDIGNQLVGPYSPDPATALQNLIEAVNQLSKAHGGPVTTIDKVVSQKPLEAGAAMPNARTAVIELATTRTTSGVSKKFHSVQRFTVYTLNGGQDTWSYFAAQLNAPEETFKHDFPVMNAIAASLRENANAINAKGEAERKQADQIVAQTNRMVAATDADIARMHKQQVEAEKSFADVDEGIRGYRKVYDTKTGEEADVNLGDVNGVVNALNETDHGRYIQVPLRDEVQP